MPTAGEEALRGRFAFLGGLHHGEDAGDGGLPERGRHPQRDALRKIDRSAEDGASLADAHGNGLTREGGLIHPGMPREDDAVEGDLLAGLYQEHVSGKHLFGRDHAHPLFRDEGGRVGLGGEQGRDGTA
jgi:hypothetical protein